VTPWLDDGDVRLYHGDALEQLAAMPSESVQCIVTSPPFWGLRDYGMPGQIGLEETPDEWCARLVAVMREARRVLRSDGVCWIEVGDTYMAGQGGRQSAAGELPLDSKRTDSAPWNGQRSDTSKMLPTRASGMKPKDLCGAPWLLAFALRADGWYLRSDTIWARPNPMPESVTDRPTKAHSYVFLLTKSARYFYDADAIREPHVRLWDANNGGSMANIDHAAAEAKQIGQGHNHRGEYPLPNPAGRNARSVWSIPTEPTPFAHFATFPQALVERCIKAGTSEHGACSECGAPWRRVTKKELHPVQARFQSRAPDDGLNRFSKNAGPHVPAQQTVTTTGWEPTCEAFVQSASAEAKHAPAEACRSGVAPCRAQHGAPNDSQSEIVGWEPPCGCTYTGDGYTEDAPVVPCVVLDPFSGSATTALVARRLGRHAIGIELNEDYLKISATRLQQLSLLGGSA
jgi:DNA modification methylase